MQDSKQNAQRLDELIAEAELGQQARAFLESDLYRCIIGMVQQEAESARVALETVDVEDKKGIRELQYHAWRARKFEDWLNELKSKGDEALEVYKNDSA